MFCLHWYYANVNPFTMEAGLIGELVKDIKLMNPAKTLFLEAINMIYQTNQVIRQERMKKEMEKSKSGGH